MNKWNPDDEMDARLASRGSEEVVMRPKTARAIIVESIQSNTSDESISNGTLNELDRLHPNYDDIVSSSLSTNTEKTIQRQDSFIRFTSAKTKNFNAYQETVINGIYSDSDESYPIHGSIVTSTSSSSEDLSMQKSEVDQNITVNETSNELDKTNPYYEAITRSNSSDSEKIAIDRVAVIKSKSPNLTKSDSHKKTIVYETSSDSNECHMDVD